MKFKVFEVERMWLEVFLSLSRNKKSMDRITEHEVLKVRLDLLPKYFFVKGMDAA